MAALLYQTATFRIEHFHGANILKGTFINCSSSDEYTDAMKAFKTVHDRVLPKYTLWDNTHFDYVISEPEEKWTNDFLNAPGIKQGNIEKVAIIAERNIPLMLSVNEMFEYGDSPLRPAFFEHEKPAMEWLASRKKHLPAPPALDSAPAIQVAGDRQTGKATISINVDAEDLTYYLKRFKMILSDRYAVKQQYALLKTLTRQEHCVLLLLLKQYDTKAIAAELCISAETVKTHRKRILSKLGCKTSSALAVYAFLV